MVVYPPLKYYFNADEADNDVATVTVLGYTFDSSSNMCHSHVCKNGNFNISVISY